MHAFTHASLVALFDSRDKLRVFDKSGQRHRFRLFETRPEAFLDGIPFYLDGSESMPELLVFSGIHADGYRLTLCIHASCRLTPDMRDRGLRHIACLYAGNFVERIFSQNLYIFY